MISFLLSSIIHVNIGMLFLIALGLRECSHYSYIGHKGKAILLHLYNMNYKGEKYIYIVKKAVDNSKGSNIEVSFPSTIV